VADKDIQAILRHSDGTSSFVEVKKGRPSRPEEPNDHRNGRHLVDSDSADEREPFCAKSARHFEGSDYSHFDARYGIDPNDQEMKRHIESTREAYGICGDERPPGLNAGLLLSEQREFADSAGSLGLQLADMLATILRRALNNRLQPSSWNIGRLLIANRSTPILQLGPPDE
jgi:hypothetical protein